MIYQAHHISHTRAYKSQNYLHISKNYCSFVRSVLRNGETDGQAVRTGEFGGTSAAMQRNGVFDNRQA